MNIQYAHQHNTYDLDLEGTLALEVPTKEFLTQLYLTHSNKTMFLSGLSIKSKKDSFEKKKGRELALKRLVPILFDFDTVFQDSTKHIYNFHSNSFKVGRKTYHVRICLTTIKESEHVKLISVYVDNVSKSLC